MSKCIERLGNRTILGCFGQLLDYECPVCHNTNYSKGSCNSHVYKKHREWAHENTVDTLKGLRDELNRRNR